MASNVTQNFIPSLWSSANDDVIYNFSFAQQTINAILDNGGKAQVVLMSDFDVLPTPGEYIYIFSNVYVGSFKIVIVHSNNSVTIDTEYISNASGTINHLRIPTFTLYKGFKSDEEFPTELPYTKVVDIKPSVLYFFGTPYLSINLKAITSRMFKITSNTVANSVDVSMFNAIRLTWDGLTTSLITGNEFNCILNCAISTDELVEYFTSISLHAPFDSAGRFLTPIDKPLISSSGVSFVSGFTIVTVLGSINKVYPVVYKYINGVKQ